VIAVVAPDATVNIIRNSVRTEKKKLTLPDTLTDVIRCPNPRCICNNENISHIFRLTDDKETYRCLYCETMSRDLK
jgi:aspartate carbamoyltransferase regulatory subunit